MSRYVLVFSKKGNMRFISHLDMQRLFRRVLYREEIKLSFSKGFNPHPLTNTVMPLSLGFEAERDYFEFETDVHYDAESLPELLNPALPEGIKFIACKELPHEKKNLSAVCEYSEYGIFIPAFDITEDELNAFLAQDKIIILKRDKKTKTMVEKDVRNMIYSVSVPVSIDDGQFINTILKAASNESINPLQLANAMVKYMGKDIAPEDIRITRKELYCTVDGKLRTLLER